MIRTLILSFMLASIVGAPTASAAGGGSEKSEKEGAEADKSMDVQNLVVPVVRNGRLVNYLFLNARIELTPGTDVWSQREKGHFLRDALIRAVHKRSLASAERFDRLDQPAAVALITGVARQVLGAGAVATVHIVGVSSLKQENPARS